ncbi:hypothetical protein AR687_21820 [Flavobacteriaceae bacterium CRH]|nr:hypothetical protein AR687_21820 [Flavobacteriaceae bacterium CRH]
MPAFFIYILFVFLLFQGWFVSCFICFKFQVSSFRFFALSIYFTTEIHGDFHKGTPSFNKIFAKPCENRCVRKPETRNPKLET